MTSSKTSFALFLALPFVAAADDWLVNNTYYMYSQSLTQKQTVFYGIDESTAIERLTELLPAYYNTSSKTFTISPATCWCSNLQNNVVYKLQSTPAFYRINTTLRSVAKILALPEFADYDFYSMHDCYRSSPSATSLYLNNFNYKYFTDNFYRSLSFDQLRAAIPVLLADTANISTDVSALVPLVESNKNINAGIALDFKAATTNAQYQRSEIINDLTTIINNRLLNQTVDYDIPQIRDDIRALVSVDPRAAISDNNALALEYFDLMGFDYSTDQAALVQAMINAGLATDNNDALGKLSSNTWRRNTLGPYVQAQRKKRDLIAQARQAGITHNFDGRALDALANPELETLLQYSFNTPASSNATLQAESLRHLDYIDQQTADSASRLNDIKQTLDGPLEVNVLNWPDDWLANSVSNALDGVFSGILDGITNFNPHYTFDDYTFFSRNLYSWRGFGQLALDQTEQNPVERDSAIGVTSFEFNPTGDFFQDVPNLLAMQSMQGADLANIFATVAIHVQSNAQEMANTDALVDQYQEDLATAAAEALDDFQSMMHYSNLLSNVQFTDTQDLLELPDGFRVFSGDWQVPEYVNIELPTWDFQQPGTDGNNPPTRNQVNPGHTITIDTTQYRSFFQNVRYASLVLYWGLLICFVLVLFRVFRAFIGIIPKTLTGNADSSYTA